MIASMRRLAPGLVAALLAAAPLGAQSLLTQVLVVAPFASAPDARLGPRIADDMRGALRRTEDKRALQVVGSDSVERMLRGQGFARPEQAREYDMYLVARMARADELLLARIEARGDTLVARAQLVLLRDARQREPLPVLRARGRDALVDSIARAVGRARLQMAPLRRCENAARAGDRAAAAREATAALRAYPRGLLGRICLARALAGAGAPADTVLRLADQVLAGDSVNIIARVLRAQALEALRRDADAAVAWARILALRPDSADLASGAAEQLLALERPRPALAALDSIAPRHPEDVRFPRLRFRALHALERWDAAAALGDSLERVDGLFATEPAFALRYVDALQRHGDTLRAVAKSARSVSEHPQDGRLYVQYLRLIAAENGAVLARGLARFPQVAELRVIAAQQARASGDRAAERAALTAAIATDGSLVQSHLRLAEIWAQDGQPDSALAALRRVPREGSAATVLRAYAMGRGVEALRAAVDSVPATYALPLGFLALADSVDSRDDTRSLLTAVTLQAARAELVAAVAGPDCEGLRRAAARLEESAQLLARGVGSGAAAEELRQAQEALAAAVGDAQRRGCGG